MKCYKGLIELKKNQIFFWGGGAKNMLKDRKEHAKEHTKLFAYILRNYIIVSCI